MKIIEVFLEALEAILAIEQAASVGAWSRQMLNDSFDAKHRFLVIKKGDQICGYVVFSHVLDEIEILTIAVHPNCQRKGYARQLLDYLVSFAKEVGCQKIFLEVRRSNQAAIRLYQQVGFEAYGVRKNYYRTADGREDGLLFVKMVS